MINSSSPLFLDGGILLLRISAPHNKAELCRQLYAGLHIRQDAPCNWDALHDFMQDLSWLDEKNIIIVHDNMRQMPAAELDVYLNVLADVLEWWSVQPEHKLLAMMDGELEEGFKKMKSNGVSEL